MKTTKPMPRDDMTDLLLNAGFSYKRAASLIESARAAGRKRVLEHAYIVWTERGWAIERTSTDDLTHADPGL